MAGWLFQTDGVVILLILRLVLAVVIFPHGAQIVLGWFGGYGLKGSKAYFKGQGIPAPLALLAIAAEFLGPLGLVPGLLTRVAAFGIACVMLVGLTVHKEHGFFYALPSGSAEGFIQRALPGFVWVEVKAAAVNGGVLRPNPRPDRRAAAATYRKRLTSYSDFRNRLSKSSPNGRACSTRWTQSRAWASVTTVSW